MLHSLQAAQWDRELSFPGVPVSLTILQAAGLVRESALRLSLSDNLCSFCCSLLAGRDLVNPFGCLPSCLKGLPAISKMMTQTSVVMLPTAIWNWATPSLMPSWEVQGLARKEKKENAHVGNRPGDPYLF